MIESMTHLHMTSRIEKNKRQRQKPSQMVLLTLAEEVTRLAGPCRETDKRIANVVGLQVEYTDSRDASARIMPEGWRIWDVEETNEGDAWVIQFSKRNQPEVIVQGIAKTECNARTAAVLRAMARDLKEAANTNETGVK